MTLLDDFYNIVEKKEFETYAAFRLSLNPEHVIYKAHFPGQPITPGVCLIKMAHELTECYLNEKLMLVEAKNVKFLNVVSPVDNHDVCLKIDRNIVPQNQSLHVKVQIDDENKVFAKMSLLFEPI